MHEFQPAKENIYPVPIAPRRVTETRAYGADDRLACSLCGTDTHLIRRSPEPFNPTLEMQIFLCRKCGNKVTHSSDRRGNHMSPLGLVDEIRMEFKHILERANDEQQASPSVPPSIEFTSLTETMLEVGTQQSQVSALSLDADERGGYIARNPFARSTASLSGMVRLMGADPTLATELRRQTEILGVNFLPPEQAA
jgi:hypothetical protein